MNAMLPLLLALPLCGDAYDVEAPAPRGFERERATDRALTIVRDLIAIDTQNPPGNEMRTARYFEELFAGVEGVETHVVDVGRGRANFVARLSAVDAQERPVLVMGHMDVVGARKDSWTTDPFVATEKDGYLFGRGSMDCKGPLAASAAAILELAPHRDRLKRDVVFLATAAEEGGRVGISWMVENRRELFGDAEFALNEGGRIRTKDGRVHTINIQTTEKLSYNVVVKGEGQSGHGSVPLPENVIAAVARAVNRVHEWRAPLSLTDTTRLYFRRLAEIESDPAVATAMRDLLGDDAQKVRAADDVLSRDPLHNAVLRTAQSLTMLNAGFRTNVIPSAASANFNVRVVPGDDIRAVVAAMNEVGAEPQVTFELQGEPKTPPPASSVETALYGAMEAAGLRMAPGAKVIPFMSTGATDGAALRAIGIPTYGILPLPMLLEDELRMHGDDERVPIRAYGWGAEFIYRTLLAVTA